MSIVDSLIQYYRDVREEFSLASRWSDLNRYLPPWVHGIQWPSSGCLVDVGCHYGFVSVYHIEKTGGRSYGFDVNPHINSLLRRHVALSPYNGKFLVQGFGLANEKGVRQSFSDSRYSGLTTADPKQVESIRTITGSVLTKRGAVPVRRLDDCKIMEPISIIKIDCEGMEPDVLRGAIGTIDKNSPLIVFEALTDGKRSECEEILRKLNYQVSPIDARNFIAKRSDVHDLSN